jgi:hypothetical protein
MPKAVPDRKAASGWCGSKRGKAAAFEKSGAKIFVTSGLRR